LSRPSDRLQTLRLAFDDATCLPAVRRWLRDAIRDHDMLLTAELVCTELVTNAIEHGGGGGSVRICITDEQRVHVEVDDRNPSVLLTVGSSRLGPHRGHGLRMIDSVATWGVVGNDSGKTVWATF
jgi:anti-sigma regulatory factor (Ser/Thr protein kinase)